MIQQTRSFRLSLTICLLLGSLVVQADEPEEKPELKIMKVDGTEPISKEHSLGKAITFLDRTSMAWTNKHKCFTCHTNYAHLMAVGQLKNKPKYFSAVKDSLVELVEKRWPDKGPRWDAEVVMAAATLALLEKNGVVDVSDQAGLAMNRVWTVQREDGGFDWLKCNWPPMESDDQYGAVMAAVGISAASDKYRSTPEAKAGLAKLKNYLKNQKLERLHHRCILLWAESFFPGWLEEAAAQEIVEDLLSLQRPDGGWNTPSLGQWSRADGKEPDFLVSDGYGTGFAIFALRKSGMDAESPSIQKGLKWLYSHQRESGRWYTRSLSRDNQHYLTHAGTALSIMAIRECDESLK
ncbi:MAG: hypothetical protein P8M80_09410 [Pirellulaceae bacterium]|nr:hypothetical protein [Pirellulaceae bacterium]